MMVSRVCCNGRSRTGVSPLSVFLLLEFATSRTTVPCSSRNWNDIPNDCTLATSPKFKTRRTRATTRSNADTGSQSLHWARLNVTLWHSADWHDHWNVTAT